MKKTILFVAFLLVGFVGFGQNERPYIIKYKTQSDTVYLNTQHVNSIHVDATGQELIHENGTEWSALEDLDTIYVFRGSETINPNYVPIDWNEASLISSNDSIGDYQIQFNGEMPELQPGFIITIDQDSIVHYIFIETVDVNGNMVSVTSSEAYLTDIFADVDFTLTTDEGGKSSAQGNVFYPVAAYVQDEQGVFRALDLERSRDWGFTHDLWQFGANYNGEVLSSGDNYSVYMQSMNFNFDLDIEMYMNFGGRTVVEVVGSLIHRYKSKTLNLNAALHGSFNTEQMLRCDIFGECSWNPGYSIWKHNLFPPLTVRFLVYGVPVILKLNSDLYREVQVTASGEISAYTGFADNADGRLGFEWSQSGGISPVATFSNTFNLSPPTVEGRGSIQGKVWAFPRVRILLYDIVGPSFDFKPYLSTTLSGGFKEELLGQTNDFCAWSFDCSTGLDIAGGLSIMHPIFSGYEIQNYSTPNVPFINIPLYHSPKRIQKASVMGSGQTKTATFNVFDQNYLFNTEVLTPLPQFVKFEANGQLSSEYGIAHNGQVTVDWTPTGNDILYAKLYNINGNVIAWDTIQAPPGLPSVTTAQVTNIGEHTASCGGNVTDDGGSPVTVRGICWSTSHNPTTGNSHVTNGSGTGSFTVSMTGLTAHTTYYVRAYATNSVGTEYGNEVVFATDEEDPDWVDLGLPSGLLWATRNVGASSSEDYGSYFAWAETQPKSMYDWDTYNYTCNNFGDGLTKYCNIFYFGCNDFTDNLTILQPGDDAATANWGGGARLPTYDEWEELYTYCTSFWTIQNGINGRRFTGSNGNTIFLPATGYRIGSSLYDVGTGGIYWSSSLYTDNPSRAWHFNFSSSSYFMHDYYGRHLGHSARPVRSAP